MHPTKPSANRSAYFISSGVLQRLGDGVLKNRSGRFVVGDKLASCMAAAGLQSTQSRTEYLAAYRRWNDLD
jgi:hypothetical protein